MRPGRDISYGADRRKRSTYGHAGDGRIRQGRTGILIIIAAAGLAAPLAACSSSGSAAQPASSAVQASGTPYVIGTDSTDTSQVFALPEAADGLVAWANYTNKHGGIFGHPVKIQRCDDQGTAEGNTNCARQLIADSNVLAVGGSESAQLGESGQPLFAAAGLPFVCATPNSPQELQSSSSFCISGGAVGAYAALVRYLTGTKSVKALAGPYIDITAGQETTDYWAGVARANGATVAEISVPPTATDYTSTIVQVQAAHSQAVLVGLAPDQAARFLQTVAQMGLQVPIGTPGAALTAPVVQAASALVGGLYYTADTLPIADVTNPTVAAYLGEMKADGYSAEIGDTSANSWMSGVVLGTALKQLGKNGVSRSALLNLLEHGSVKNVPVLGTLSLSGAPSGFPKLANQDVAIALQHGTTVTYVAEHVPGL